MKGKSPAGTALATVLLGLLETIEGAAGEVLQTTDPEVLHDLRVAVRRSRSLLKLAGDVLPTDAAEDLAWLADLTTPTRDLDVFVARLTPPSSELEPFVRQLRARRGVQRRALRQGLRSERFAEFVATLRAALSAVVPGDRTIGEVAGARLVAAHQRVVKHAKRLTADAPAADLHKLRKRCKELRYLLEAVQPVCGASSYRSVRRELKDLQDELGALQDAQVRRTLVLDSARSARADLGPQTLVAMGALVGADETAAEPHRAAVVERLHRFARPKMRRKVAGLVG